MKNRTKKYFVISHTHWDREWYMPFEQFRYRLVDLMDHLLEIIDEQPDYVFHLDAQTVVLEDYLEIRPEREEELKAKIRSGNILIGPWYLQSDFYLTSGEALVRNLLEGRRVAEKFGPCADVGYAPDQFGNVSQLPQVLLSFGIHSFLFGRGYSFYELDEKGELVRVPRDVEFFWEGADGSRILSSYMYFWYNNAQRFSADIDKAVKLVEYCEKGLVSVSKTNLRLLMNGVDHLEAQENLLPILEEVQKKLPEASIRQSDMKTYFETLAYEVLDNDLKLDVHRGALNLGQDYELLRGCWSSRIYLKRDNVLAQHRLECELEPVMTSLMRLGLKGVYDADRLRYLWRYLLRNQPHDSICGCSNDHVHDQMESRYQAARDLSDMMLKKVMERASAHAADLPGALYRVTLFNPAERRVCQPAEAVCDFLSSHKVGNFVMKNAAGEEVPFEVVSRERAKKDVFSPINLPGVVDVDRTVIRFPAELEPLAFRTYYVCPAEGPAPRPATTQLNLENEFFRFEINAAGGLDLFDKKGGRTLREVLSFEDQGDRGDDYVFVPVGGGRLEFPLKLARIRFEGSTPLCRRMTAEFTLRLPKGADFRRDRRLADRLEVKGELTLTVRQNSPIAELGYTFTNTVRDHRLRLCLNTGLNGTLWTDSSFDAAPFDESRCCVKTFSKTACNFSFAAVEEGERGFGLLTEGQHEVERENDRLYVTLVRSTSIISGTGTEGFSSPGNQCLRALSSRLGLVLYEGGWQKAGLPSAAKTFRSGGFVTAFTAVDPKAFSGGRAAVQDTTISEQFYRDEPQPELILPDNQAPFDLRSEEVLVTAFKAAEDGNGSILRLCNLSDRPVLFTLAAKGTICPVNLAEERVGEESTDICLTELRPKEILTLRIV